MGLLLMVRIILLLMFVAIVALAVTSVISAVRSAHLAVASQTQRDTMPDTVRRIAYIALIVLMFGVVSGWLGAS